MWFRRVSRFCFVVLVLLQLFLLGSITVTNLTDLGVFSFAVHHWVHGEQVYDPNLFSGGGFPFIYPPFALIPFAFLELMWRGHGWLLSMQFLWQILTLASLWLLFSSIARQAGTKKPWRLGLVFVGISIFYEPVVANLSMGQIDVLIWALAIWDCLYNPSKRWRGFLLALAFAIKLTPAVLFLLLILRRDWITFIRAAILSVLTVALGFLILPKEAWFYWHTYVGAMSKVAHANHAFNQSATAMLSRSGMPLEQAQHLMTMLLPVVMIIAFAGAWILWKRGLRLEVTLLFFFAFHLCLQAASTHHLALSVIALPIFFFSDSRFFRVISGWWMVLNIALAPYHYWGFQDSLYKSNHFLFANFQCLAMILWVLCALGYAFWLWRSDKKQPAVTAK
ncbi:MAG: glycosyltransferase family 87 protein [Corynebacterium sp.]|nr:glycosyltransferase family 87 protein [Corynebacterium sp.]